MGSPLKNFCFISSIGPESVRFVTSNSVRRSDARQPALHSVGVTAKFPERPGLAVLSETIPLFYIALNNRGFWVARDSAASCGGVFMLRRSAVRFARDKSAPAGCAMMFLSGALELDIDNQGSGLVETINKAVDLAWRFAPTFAASMATAIAELRKVVARISYAFADVRRNRSVIERELFLGQYTLVSKNDDDLPVP